MSRRTGRSGSLAGLSGSRPGSLTTRHALLLLGPAAAVLPLVRALALGVDHADVAPAVAAAVVGVVFPLIAAARLGRQTVSESLAGLLSARGRPAHAVLGLGAVLVGWQLTATEGGTMLEFGLIAALVTVVAARQPRIPRALLAAADGRQPVDT